MGTGVLPIGGGSSAVGYTEYWVPDPYAPWTNTGVASPLYACPVFRVGAKLYLFGGYDSAGAQSAVIYQADYDASGTVPVFTSTGSSLPVASGMGRGRIGLIGSTLYIFGSNDNLSGSRYTKILSAPLATPTVWSDTGATFGTLRQDASLMIANGLIGVIGGWNGVGIDSTIYTSTATPTSGWATSGSIGGGNTWQMGAYLTNSQVVVVGGFTSSTVRRGAISRFPLFDIVRGSTLPKNVDTNPGVLFMGSEVFVSNSTATVSCAIEGNETSLWNDLGNLVNTTVSFQEAWWIGGDGRAYTIESVSGTRRIFRSGRRKVYVPTDTIATLEGLFGPYTDLPGYLADGTPSKVPMHVRMGIAPWWTDRRTAF